MEYIGSLEWIGVANGFGNQLSPLLLKVFPLIAQNWCSNAFLLTFIIQCPPEAELTRWSKASEPHFMLLQHLRHLLFTWPVAKNSPLFVLNFTGGALVFASGIPTHTKDFRSGRLVFDENDTFTDCLMNVLPINHWQNKGHRLWWTVGLNDKSATTQTIGGALVSHFLICFRNRVISLKGFQAILRELLDLFCCF